MLHEDESPTWLQDAVDLDEGSIQARDGAENQGGENGLHALVGEGKGLRVSPDKVNPAMLTPGFLKEKGVHETVGFHGDHSESVRKIPEVGSGTAPDLHESAGQAGKERPLPVTDEGIVFSIAPGHEPGQEATMQLVAMRQEVFLGSWIRGTGLGTRSAAGPLPDLREGIPGSTI